MHTLITYLDNGPEMRAFFKIIPNDWLIWADGPNKLWGIWGIFSCTKGQLISKCLFGGNVGLKKSFRFCLTFVSTHFVIVCPYSMNFHESTIISSKTKILIHFIEIYICVWAMNLGCIELGI